jgi:hypothetical protein
MVVVMVPPMAMRQEHRLHRLHQQRHSSRLLVNAYMSLCTH